MDNHFIAVLTVGLLIFSFIVYFQSQRETHLTEMCQAYGYDEYGGRESVFRDDFLCYNQTLICQDGKCIEGPKEYHSISSSQMEFWTKYGEPLKEKKT